MSHASLKHTAAFVPCSFTVPLNLTSDLTDPFSNSFLKSETIDLNCSIELYEMCFGELIFLMVIDILSEVSSEYF